MRSAVAQSRSREPLPGMLHLPVDESPTPRLDNLWDPKIVELDSDRVKSIYKPWLGHRGVVQLQWKSGRVCVFNSRGVRRQTQVTAAHVRARVGRRPGGGQAAGAARTLASLRPDVIVERARQRHAAGSDGELPSGPPASGLFSRSHLSDLRHPESGRLLGHRLLPRQLLSTPASGRSGLRPGLQSA